ncbi:hypothetical protein ABFA07_014659 [Porites harrisoni]
MASFVRQGAQSWTLFLLLTYTLTQVTGTQSSNTPSGCTTASSFLGMTNRKIHDTDITASSELNSNSSASNARLNNTKSWVADRNDTQPWIQVNLGKIMNITAISTQGFPGSGFVSSFYFSYNTSEMEWLNYTNHGGLVKVFQGNTNDNGTKRVLVNPLVTAQYIRLHPTNCSGHCALRMEFYGCKSDPTIGLPGQPLSLKQISISSSMINITWDPPIDIGDGIKGYTVKWQEVNGTSGSMQKVVPPLSFNSASLTVTPYTWYDIHVQAYNDEGIGPWSKPLRVQSSESVPSAAPANFILSSSYPLSLTASWDAIPVKQQQGKLLGYQVFYKKEGHGNEQNGTVGPDQLNYNITDLEFASYSVRVAGFTAVGIGNSTVVQTKTPNEGAPSPVTNLELNVLSSKSISVTWKPPEILNGNLKRYVVTYGTARDKLNERRNSPTAVSYQLTELEEFTVYYVQVFAETSVSGKLSEIVHAKTLEDVPSAPPVIDQEKTEAEDAHTIRVTWEEIAEKDQNGIIIVYTVAYKVEGQPTQLSFNTTDKNTVIKGLKPYTSYCLRVRGYTKIGPSDWSPCTPVKTLQSGPSRPLGVVVEASSSTTIEVKWSAPAEPNGIIKNYLIEYGKDPDQQTTEKVVTDRTFEFTLTGLEKFTTYYIKVRGKTSEKGNASEVLNATTSEDRPSAPTKFSGKVLSDKEILITWEEPVNANGVIRSYYIRVYDTKSGQEAYNKTVPKEGNNEQSLRVSDLKPYTNFNFTIQAKTIELGEMAYFTAKTLEGEPGNPADVTAELEEDNINVTWEEPADPNGIILKYNVYFQGRRAYNNSFKDDFLQEKSKTSRYTSITIDELKPGTEYSIYVTAFTKKGEGARSNAVTVRTPAKAPSAPPVPQFVKGSNKPTEMTILLTKSSDSNGRVVAHEVVVEKVGTVSKRSTSSLPDNILGYKEAMANGDQYYLAARFERDKGQVPRKFVLGDGETYGGYNNAPLEPMTEYKVYVRAATDVNGKLVYGEAAEITLPPTDAEPVQTTPSNNVGIIAGVLGALVLIVIVIIAVLLYKKYYILLLFAVNINCRKIINNIILYNTWRY